MRQHRFLDFFGPRILRDHSFVAPWPKWISSTSFERPISYLFGARNSGAWLLLWYEFCNLKIALLYIIKWRLFLFHWPSLYKHLHCYQSKNAFFHANFAMKNLWIMDPWSINGVITPSEDLINLFQGWNKTKSSEKRLVSYNRAKQWICRLLK